MSTLEEFIIGQHPGRSINKSLKMTETFQDWANGNEDVLVFNLKTMNVNNGNEDSVLNIKAEIFSHLPFLLFNPAENFSL